MTNRVEREIIRLNEVLNEKYDMEKLFNVSPLELEELVIPDAIHQALEYWFSVRIRKTKPNGDGTKRITSNIIKHNIKKDLGISLPHNVIGRYMTLLIGKDNVMSSGLTPWDLSFLFMNVEIIPLEECAVMKIFIAQPMSGVPDEEVEKIRVHVSELMIKKFGKNIEIVDQFHVPEEEMPIEPLERPGIHLLGRSIQFLADVDLVVFVGDFLHAKGCCVELAVCKEYDIPFEVYNISDIDKRDNSNDWLY